MLWLFTLHLVLIHPVFFLNLSEINPWDEAAYINSGRTLLAGRMPEFASNPLVDLFYALVSLPFRGSPYWMSLTASLGRLLLFALLWLALYRVAQAASSRMVPAIALGIFLVTPLATDMLRFPSDPLFAGLAGLSFARLLRFQHTREVRNLWIASAWMGLAALARNDGLILGVMLIALAALETFPRRRAVRAVLASGLPLVALVGGYVLFYGVVTGEFALGTMDRTYENFEAGHQTIYAGTGELSPVVEAKLEARRVFGTREENATSVFRAIRRAPSVYLQRLEVVVRGLPRNLLHAYGIRFAALLALLAVRGAVELLREKRGRVLLLFLLWPVHLATGFVITLFREGHLQFPYYLVFTLAAVGVGAALANRRDRREQAVWAITLGGLVLYGWLGNKLAIGYGALVFGLGMLTVFLWQREDAGVRARSAPNRVGPALLILLSAGLVIRGNFPSPEIPALGREAKEQAVLAMQAHLPPGAKVAAGSPGVVWAAGMTYAGLTSTDVPADKAPAAFLDWMMAQGVQAVYVDHTLYNVSPKIWARIKPHIGVEIERVYAGDEGDIQVLLLPDGP